MVVQLFSFLDFIYSRYQNEECKCVDGNATDVKFKKDDQYWCCKTPNTTCINGICQGKKLPLSQQCHDDTTIYIYTIQSKFVPVTHPRCNHYPTSLRGISYRNLGYVSRSFIDVCRDNRYDLNSAKYIQAKVRPITYKDFYLGEKVHFSGRCTNTPFIQQGN